MMKMASGATLTIWTCDHTKHHNQQEAVTSAIWPQLRRLQNGSQSYGIAPQEYLPRTIVTIVAKSQLSMHRQPNFSSSNSNCINLHSGSLLLPHCLNAEKSRCMAAARTRLLEAVSARARHLGPAPLRALWSSSFPGALHKCLQVALAFQMCT